MAHERQSIGIPVLQVSTHGLTPEVERVILGLQQETQKWLQLLAEGVDTTMGHRGQPTFFASINALGHEIRNVGRPLSADSVQTRRYSLSLEDPEADPHYSAQGLQLRDVADADAPANALTLGQATTLVNQSLVTSRGINPATEVAATSAVGTVQSRWSREDHVHNLRNTTFTATGTGFTAAVTATASYATVLDAYAWLTIGELTGTSNATSFTITGLPAEILPPQTLWFPVRVFDNGVAAFGLLRLNALSTTIDLFPNAAAGAWTNSGTKTLSATAIAYTLV